MSTKQNQTENPDTPPIALTFFLTPIQRRCVLRALKPLGDTRAEALLAALKLSRLSGEARS